MEKHGYKIDLLNTPPNKKSADSYNHTLGYKQEYKVNNTSSKSSIDNLLRDGKKQADNIVLEIKSEISLADLTDALTDRVGRSRNIESVLIIKDNRDVTYTREQIISKGFKNQQVDFK